MTNTQLKRRKNWEDGEDETRKKTKKIARSPGKSKSKTESDKLETMKQLTDEVKGVRLEQREYGNEIRKLRKGNEQTKRENAKLKEEVKTINARLDAMEKERGLILGDNEMLTPKESMENIMKNQLESDIGVKSAVKLGMKTYLVELINANEKMKV